MIILRLEVRDTGAVRAQVTENYQLPGRFAVRESWLIEDKRKALAVYTYVFGKYTVDEICVRTYLRGEGWVNPQRINI